MSAPLRERCIEAMTASVWPDGKWSAEAECMLDAVLPILSAALLPHRWDVDYPDSAPAACGIVGPDTFYSGIRHAARVVQELLPPTVASESSTAPISGGSRSEPPS